MLICLYLPDSLIFPPSLDPSSSRRRKEKSNTIYGRPAPSWWLTGLFPGSKQISSPSCYPKVGRIGQAPCPLSLMFRNGIRLRTTSPVVVWKAQTPRTSRTPFTKERKPQPEPHSFCVRM
ncbi:NADH dehydrogenase [ubiquinone] iron-sulfur protein 2 [Fagus crenata]